MSRVIKEQCFSCDGKGLDPWDDTCEWCEGRGWRISRRLYIWNRRKAFLGRAHPRADSNGNEKWPRFMCEVPPEIAAELDGERKKLRTVDGTPPRTAIVRAALQEWLERRVPEADEEVIVDVEAVEEGGALNPGSAA